MFKSSKAYCNGELIWDAKDPKFNHCLKKEVEQLHSGKSQQRQEYVNHLLDERKAVKLRLAELESELEELGVGFYEKILTS